MERARWLGFGSVSHRGRCSCINQSRRRTPDGTRPGCEGSGLGGWGLIPLRTGAVLLHETPAGAVLGRVGAPAPGAKGAGSVVGVWLRFAPRAVFLHETGAGAGGRTVGAPAPGANAGARGLPGLESHRLHFPQAAEGALEG